MHTLEKSFAIKLMTLKQFSELTVQAKSFRTYWHRSPFAWIGIINTRSPSIEDLSIGFVSSGTLQ